MEIIATLPVVIEPIELVWEVSCICAGFGIGNVASHTPSQKKLGGDSKTDR